MIIFGSGALRMPARILLEEVERVEDLVRDMIYRHNLEVENSGFFKTIWDKLEELEG